MERISRLKALKLMAMGGFTLFACKEADPPIAAAILTYYPEIIKYPVKESGQIITENSTTHWLNLSTVTFQADAVKGMLQYWEDVAQRKQHFTYLSELITISPRPRKNKIIFLIPENAPPPYWADDPTGTTTDRFSKGPCVSFVKVFENKNHLPPSRIFTTPEAAIQKSLAIESCQSVLQISSTSPEKNLIAQKIICNSLGSALAVKQKGSSYQSYLDWAQNVIISPHSQAVQSESYRLYVLTESEYLQLPMVESVIKR